MLNIVIFRASFHATVWKKNIVILKVGVVPQKRCFKKSTSSLELRHSIITKRALPCFISPISVCVVKVTKLTSLHVLVRLARCESARLRLQTLFLFFWIPLQWARKMCMSTLCLCTCSKFQSFKNVLLWREKKMFLVASAYCAYWEHLNNKAWHVIAKEIQNPGFLFFFAEDDSHTMHSHPVIIPIATTHTHTH